MNHTMILPLPSPLAQCVVYCLADLHCICGGTACSWLPWEIQQAYQPTNLNITLTLVRDEERHATVLLILGGCKHLHYTTFEPYKK